MRRSLWGSVVVLALLGGAGEAAQAQETFTPVFKAPYRAFEEHEFGASISDPGEGVDFAMEGFYGYGKDKNDFGLRAGFADVDGGNTRILIGGDFRTRVLNYSESFPLDGALTVGFGANFGEGDDAYALPVGISLGRQFDMEGSDHQVHPLRGPQHRAGLRHR